MQSEKKNTLEFYQHSDTDQTELPFIEEGIAAGFPSPADDFKEKRISLDETLIKNKEATFYARVRGDSMIGAGLDNGDLIVIDRSIAPENHKIAVCFIDGEFTVKRLKIKGDTIVLMPENDDYEPITVTKENTLTIWGVVTYVIKKM